MAKLHHERILIIEDEELIRFSLRARLSREGYLISEAGDAATGLERIEREKPDLVLLDYRLPGRDGLSILREVSEKHPEIVVILMTAHSTVESVVEAMRLGAYTYLNKPFDLEELVLHVQKGLETTSLRREVDRLRQSQGEAGGRPFVVAESAAMKEILETIKKVNAVGSTTILLRGENGTGKDVLARIIHATSARAHDPFLNITCTALADTLLESELFGHERGAFTDARQRKQGLLELAHRGTVFLDEIGDMSLALQAKLLRFLEERMFRRVGGTEDLQVDVRVVAATNRDLEKAVAEGLFRPDLYYRISVIPIVVPPLRDRPEDILPLAHLFLDRFSTEFKRRVAGFDPDAVQCLQAHDWPGNVRELRNVIERALILGSGATVSARDLPPELRKHAGVPAAVVSGRSSGRLFELPREGLDWEAMERDLVVQALERTGHNQTQAARLLGMTRDQIRYRVEKFALPGAPPRENG